MLTYLFMLMTSWAIVCDVYYLEPTTIQVSLGFGLWHRLCESHGSVADFDGMQMCNKMICGCVHVRRAVCALVLLLEMSPWLVSTAGGRDGHRVCPEGEGGHLP